MNNMEKYLPIGTVVLLKEGKKKLMITGFAVSSYETKGEIYDYMGCLYPEGVVSSDKNLLFNHDKIDKVCHMGYIDEEWKNIEVKIKELVKISENSSKEETNDIDEKVEKKVEKEQSKPMRSSENMFRVNTDLFN